ncbi:uncharacterized protein LOC143549621 [Bidens hawaiensis]|uniref:uncharacterized protein LOC143549621 n=1 Tax=Bidens hawaiensis TaxID=980011 RepID=UPI004049196F
MENEKKLQKRDYLWVNGDSDVEPVAKKQVKEGSVEDEAEPCANRLLIEGLDVIKPQGCVEQDVKYSFDGLELVPCGRRQTEDLNGNMPASSDGESVQQCLKGLSQQICEIKQAAECLDCVSIERSVNEGSCDMELDTSGEKHSSEVSNDMEIEPVIEQPVKECLNETVQESHFRMQRTEVESGIEAEPSIEQPVKKYSNEMETDACGKIQQTKALNESEPELSVQQPVIECLDVVELEVDEKKQTTESMNDTGVQPSVINQTPHALNGTKLEISVDQSIKECQNEAAIDTCNKEALNETEPEPSVQQLVKECLDDMELEVDEKKQTTESMNDGIQPSVINQTSHALNDTKLEISADQSIKECQNEVVIDTCTKEAKEASNDDISSEVSNPNVSPRDNSSSFQTVSSQPDGKLVMKDQVVCGEITSACSGNSSCEASSSHEEHGTNDTYGMVSTSHVVIEVPKHASTTSGIRKITFKFSKRKEDYDNQLSASALKCTSSAFVNGTRKIHRSPHISEQGLHNPDDSLQHPTNMESINGNVVPDGYPTTVKRLLSTGILDGAKVTYVSASGELIGIIKDCGYLCGCATCNFANVLCAQEFEEHAGGKTRHPNNHIYLENGKPIYSIIQAMKTAPLSMVDEVIKNVAGSSVNEELLQVWKGSLQRHMDRDKIDNSHHMKLMNLYHSTASHEREDGSSPYYCYPSFALESQTIVNETLKERKCLFKKPRSYTSSTAVKTKGCSEGGHKKRDNDLHRLLFMPNGLPDGTELAYYARGKKILDGYKQGNGIVCGHCDTEISPSQFEAHAGWAAKRQPYRHICIPNGLALHDIAMLLANGQSITTSNSDDMCAVCGDRGELVICDGCPRAFHAVCLGLEGVPSEDWHCPYCRDSVGSGRKAAAEFRPIIIRLTRVVKAREYETGGCVICRAQDFSVAEFDDRTVMLCDQCEKEYHVGCLRESGRCDLKALPLDKWFCCNHCDMIHSAIQDVVVNGATVVSGSVLSTINKKHIEKGIVSGAPNEIRWRMLSGKSRFPEHLPLLSRAAAIFRECFDPIVAKSGRDLIPVMVYGRNISGQEFGGIYCVVMMAGPIVVSAGLLRVFGREIAELPLVATSRQHQGKGYFQALFFSIEELLLSLGVQLLVLPAAEEAESIWTKKLGFRKMSDERYSEYARDIQLTIFKGTSMLEKDLKRAT